MDIYRLLDIDYGADGDQRLRELLAAGADINALSASSPECFEPPETPLHVATRRRRLGAIEILLDHGAEINAENGHQKTAYAHAARRGFDEITELLAQRGADSHVNEVDRFAIAIVTGQLDEARLILTKHPGVARTGNPAEDRLLADVAGRNPSEPVELLIHAGADLAAGGLDGGTPLHQAAWFGQPENARLLVAAGAPLEVFDPTHRYSPLGWAAHGSRYSGGAAERQEVYEQIVRTLLDAGAKTEYPADFSSTVQQPYATNLLNDASPSVAAMIREHVESIN